MEINRFIFILKSSLFKILVEWVGGRKEIRRTTCRNLCGTPYLLIFREYFLVGGIGTRVPTVQFRKAMKRMTVSLLCAFLISKYHIELRLSTAL